MSVVSFQTVLCESPGVHFYMSIKPSFHTFNAWTTVITLGVFDSPSSVAHEKEATLWFDPPDPLILRDDGGRCANCLFNDCFQLVTPLQTNSTTEARSVWISQNWFTSLFGFKRIHSNSRLKYNYLIITLQYCYFPVSFRLYICSRPWYFWENADLFQMMWNICFNITY